MTYKETLDWMFGQLPMYQQKGAAALNAKLDNIIHFCNVLDNPQSKFKSIHVAGTNGKGSSSHMLASILQEAGYKVGLYTSPHLKDFRERIKIDGEVVSKKFVKEFIAKYRSFFEYNKLSFFEMTVGMAFSYFEEEKVDIAVIEVGLGGRLDSTNIITPEVALITNIGMDHTQFLGDTLEKIALEKAGVIKSNVPVIISETQAETKMIFNLIAHQLKSNIVFADAEPVLGYQTDLLGDYQQRNINGVVACIHQLKNFEVPEAAISKGLQNVVKNTGLMGRWQVLQQHPLVVCDTAHNKEGLQLVLKQVEKQSFEKLHVVLGFVKDKDVRSVLTLFPKDAHYYFVKPSIPRGMEATQLRELAEEQGLKGKVCKSVNKGLKKALKNAGQQDMIYVGGSTFVVAEVV
ncbi:MAG: bifunctional folylpolyglutamate synthase/dihydrofolate synthase [Muricauda sp.]|nr:folylpolyglutamate synthase/dihydrofolate synthase family protein [Allomuricauda sp.]MBO6533545.1 bifunctional folylpolyglutamate synthase/dihydrofolate synthase [Allomuricauda sp.]MBO6590609.1 bifunctional folylpolyglutamate synthase/dihydrofolate synthase [Allomuricauda sp.]MBO6620229.1 bifunctional folylpolyglutamate synthase/dihydrofolate synthase [Allomuricauda sp.]MBO6646141.1 bifunctional folylpolyglutamate synthase/dihydrofolate synthase [Allomuricauda sp.]MBO6748573.1 bifunctional 